MNQQLSCRLSKLATPCAAPSRTIFGCAYASDDVDPGSCLFVFGATEGKQQVHRNGSKENYILGPLGVTGFCWMKTGKLSWKNCHAQPEASGMFCVLNDWSRPLPGRVSPETLVSLPISDMSFADVDAL